MILSRMNMTLHSLFAVMAALSTLGQAQAIQARELVVESTFVRDIPSAGAESLSQRLKSRGPDMFLQQAVKPYIKARFNNAAISADVDSLAEDAAAGNAHEQVLFQRETEHGTLEMGVQYLFDADSALSVVDRAYRSGISAKDYRLKVTIEQPASVRSSDFSRQLQTMLEDEFSLDKGIKLVNRGASDGEILITIEHSTRSSEFQGVQITSDELFVKLDFNDANAQANLNNSTSVSGSGILRKAATANQVMGDFYDTLDDTRDRIKDIRKQVSISNRDIKVAVEGNSQAAERFRRWLSGHSIGVVDIDAGVDGSGSRHQFSLRYRGSAGDFFAELKLQQQLSTSQSFKVKSNQGNTVTVTVNS